MRFCIGGCVENMLAENPLSGLTMNRWETASFTFMGLWLAPCSSFSSALAKCPGVPAVLRARRIGLVLPGPGDGRPHQDGGQWQKYGHHKQADNGYCSPVTPGVPSTKTAEEHGKAGRSSPER